MLWWWATIKTLVLSEEDVKSLVTIEDALEAVELAFRERSMGHAQMPPKMYLTYQKYSGDLRTMPAYLENLDISAVKVVTVHPGNSTFGLPTVNATILLIDPKDGQLLSVMSGGFITAIRTGAAGGIAAKYLAIREPATVGFVGAGFQARTQLYALLEVFHGLKEIRVWDIRPEATKIFVKEIESRIGAANVYSSNDVKAVVEESDIVVTTTPSKKPLVMNDWVRSGTHFNCIGADAPGKEELDPAILRRSKLVVDDWVQASHSGEINVSVSAGILSRDNIWAELGEVVAGIKPGRTSEKEITVFDSTGLAIQDAAVAEIAYRRAVEKKVGSYITL